MSKKHAGGRPRKMTEETERQLAALCRMKPTLMDCAYYLDVHPNTIEKYLKAKYDCSFSEFRDKHMVHTRFSLIRTAIKKAENGDNTMLIFSLKNLCGWADKNEPERGDDIPQLTINLVKPE